MMMSSSTSDRIIAKLDDPGDLFGQWSNLYLPVAYAPPAQPSDLRELVVQASLMCP